MCHKWSALHAVFSGSCPQWQGHKTLGRLTHVLRCAHAVANPPGGKLLTHEQKVQQPNMLRTFIHCCSVKFRLPFVIGMQGVDCDDMRGS